MDYTDSYCINPVMYNKENKLSCCFEEYIYTCVFKQRNTYHCNRLFRVRTLCLQDEMERYTYKICAKIDSLGFVKQVFVNRRNFNIRIMILFVCHTLLNMLPMATC